MALNKKGMFFTLLAIVVLALVIFSFFTVRELSSQNNAMYNRIETFNSFIFSLEKNLARQVYTTGFRTVFIIEKSIVDTGEYITNITLAVNEITQNGTLFNQTQEIMNGATIPEIENNLRLTAEKMNLNASLSNSTLILTQETPYEIKLIFRTNISIIDRGGLASWNEILYVNESLNLSGFEDPIVIVSTLGLASKTINFSFHSPLINGADITNLSDYALNGYYRANPNAPSFLKRLEGSLQADPNGIESIVNLQKFSELGIIVKDKSVVDYIYFSSSNPQSFFITGMPAWFKLDNQTINTYGASSIAYS